MANEQKGEFYVQLQQQWNEIKKNEEDKKKTIRATVLWALSSL